METNAGYVFVRKKKQSVSTCLNSWIIYNTCAYRVFFALSFSAHSVGHTMAFLQDYTKAKYSASLIFQMIEKPTDIDSQSNDGDRPVRCCSFRRFVRQHIILCAHIYLFIFIRTLTNTRWFAGNHGQNIVQRCSLLISDEEDEESPEQHGFHRGTRTDDGVGRRVGLREEHRHFASREVLRPFARGDCEWYYSP